MLLSIIKISEEYLLSLSSIDMPMRLCFKRFDPRDLCILF